LDEKTVLTDLGGQHGCVGRGLVAIGLDLHATGDTAKRFTGNKQKQIFQILKYNFETNTN
jgi:hypothetical protein